MCTNAVQTGSILEQSEKADGSLILPPEIDSFRVHLGHWGHCAAGDDREVFSELDTGIPTV